MPKLYYMRCFKCDIHKHLGAISWKEVCDIADEHDRIFHINDKKEKRRTHIGNYPAYPHVGFYTWATDGCYEWLFGKTNNYKFPLKKKG